jgi:2,3-bisphosphoglycerate-dependent phosphoglycerate mutase
MRWPRMGRRAPFGKAGIVISSDREILFVRHGETTWNRERRYQGHIDVPLSDVGIHQAHQTAARLAGTSFAAGFSSDLSRAAETARIISESTGVPLTFCREIREASLGDLEGKQRIVSGGAVSTADAEALDPDIYAKPTNGESLFDMSVRCRSFLESLDRQDDELPDGPVLVVAHAGSLRMLMSVLLGLPVSASRVFHFSNCSVTTVALNRSRRPLLISHNDCSHLT